MKNKNAIFLLFWVISTIKLFGQNYNFNGTISREVLENYLDRSITMQGQSDIEGSNMLTEQQRIDNILMLNDIGAKFVGRIAGWWESGWGQTNHDNLFTKCSINVSNIHANDPKVICQAGVFEYVSPTVGTFSIPAYVFQAFGLPVQNRTFNYSAMLYPSPASQYIIYNNPMSESDRQWIPDITQQETQLWFYYMATRYISVGCEAIHFGQVGIMNRRDIGNVNWWLLIQKIRQFAATRNRGVVICDAHVPCGGMYYEPTIGLNQSQWNTYCPNYNPNGLLLFDFHSLGIKYTKVSCNGNQQAVKLELAAAANGGLIGKSLGGVNPQGWRAVHNPSLNEYDNSGVSSVTGCSNNEWWTLWGWDEISWFALQTESIRNSLLIYTYYKMKCLDENAHLQMPGMRGVTPGNGNSSWVYRANTGIHNQQGTIKDIWNNSYQSNPNWTHHNFTDENVSNQPSSPHVNNSLIFWGTDRMYYIAADGYIHGYIKDVTSTDIWNTVSPSFSAQIYNNQNTINQVKAKSALTISPDGNTILYIGVDGYIHGFTVNNVWDYTYFDFVKSPMVNQKLKADRNLIFASNTRVYYVAKENNGTGASRVHGFIKNNGNWGTVSPTYASQVSSNSMVQVAGALTYSPFNNRLYYVGIDGFLYYYNIDNDWNYTYTAVPKTQLQSQNLRVMPNKIAIYNNYIYYIGKELASNNALRIHCLVESNNTWNTVSPSWSASAYNNQNINTQVQPNGNEITISQNGQKISYIGSDNKVYYYQDINSGWNFSWNSTYGSNNIPASNSLQYKDDNTLFYNSTSDKKVHYIKFQESYCQNPNINFIEQSFVYSMRSYEDVAYEDVNKTNNENSEIKIYPNPASSTINIEMNSDSNSYTDFNILDQAGRVVKSGKITTSISQLSVDQLPNGIYLIVIKKQNGTIFRQKTIILNG